MRKGKILIVEDETITAMDLKGMLESFEYGVAGIVRSGEDAVRAVEAKNPDLILMDIILAGKMDGIEAATEVRKSLETPVVYLTGNADVMTVERARETEPYGYVTKPINPFDLYSTIDTALNRRELEMKIHLQHKEISETNRRLEETRSELARANRRLREKEELFRLLAENSADMIYRFRFAPEPGFEYVNPAVEKLTGYSPEEHYADSGLGLKIIHPEDRPRLEAYFRNAGVFTDPLILRWIRKDGSVMWTEQRNVPVYDDKGNLVAMQGVARDITERVRQEKAHEQAASFLKTVLNTVPSPIFYKDREGVYLGCNRAFADIIFGKPQDYIVGKTLFELGDSIPRELASVYRERDVQLLGAPGVQVYEAEVRCADGERRNFQFHKATFTDMGGSVAGIVGVMLDVSELRKAEASIKRERDNFLAIFKAAPVGLLLLDRNTVVAQANETAAAMVLRDPAEMIGLRGGGALECENSLENPLGCGFAEACPSCPLRSGVERVLSTGTRLHGAEINPTLLVNGKPEERWLSVSAEPIELDGAPCVIVAVDDITDQKLREKELNSSLETQQTLLRELHHRVKNNLQVIISMMNLQTRGTDDDTLLSAFRVTINRVRAMALVHEKLYHSRLLSKIDFSGYTRMLVGALEANMGGPIHPITMEVRVEDGIELAVDRAVPCGLIVNEIITNAFKHAFPPSFPGPGVISIALNRAEGGIITLVIADNGIGMPESIIPERAESVGLSLLSLLTKQVNGTLSIERHSGTRYTISLPGS